MSNPISGRILWRGKGTHPVAQHWNPETKTEKINELVAKVLAQFPSSKAAFWLIPRNGRAFCKGWREYF